MSSPSYSLYPGPDLLPGTPDDVYVPPVVPPAPAIPAVAEYWLEELETTQPGDEFRGYPLRIFLGGLGVAFGEAHDLARDPEILLDPDRVPSEHLPWLGQFAGVHPPASTTPAAFRPLITSPPAFERGTVAAIKSAAVAGEGPSSALTGSQFVQLIERDGSPKNLTVITIISQTPDPAATLRRIQSQTPAWLNVSLVTVSGWTVGDLEDAYGGGTVGSFEAAFTTVLTVENNTP